MLATALYIDSKGGVPEECIKKCDDGGLALSLIAADLVTSIALIAIGALIMRNKIHLSFWLGSTLLGSGIAIICVDFLTSIFKERCHN